MEEIKLENEKEELKENNQDELFIDSIEENTNDKNNEKKEKKTFKSIVLKNHLIRNFIIIVYYFLIMEVLAPLIAPFIRNLVTDVDALQIGFEWGIYVLLLLGIVFIIPDLVEEGKVFGDYSIKKMMFYMFVGVALTYATVFVCNIILNAVSDSATSANEDTIDSMLLSKGGLLLIPVVCFIGPIVEEVVFRVGLQKGLIKLHVVPVIAIIISGTVFGFLHVLAAGDFIQVIPYVGMGYVFGFWYYKAKSVYPVMFIHIFNNCLFVAATYILIILEKIGM